MPVQKLKKVSDPKDIVRFRTSAQSTAKRQRKTRKVVVLGSTKCGKSAFVKRLLDNSFAESYIPTIEDCTNRDYRYKGFNLNIDFIDTSGPFLFPAMRDLNIKRADILLLLYEVNNKPSLKEAGKCYEKICELRGDNVPLVLVGTKIDLYKKYKHSQDIDLCNNNGDLFNSTDVKHILTSARNNINISDALELALDEVIRKIHSMSLSANYIDPPTEKDKCCCNLM